MNAPGAAFGSILVAVDGSESAQKAVRVAIEMAVKFAARLTVLNIVEIPASSYYPDREAEIDVSKEPFKTEGEKMVSAAASSAEERGVETKQEVVRHMGHSTAEGITEYATKNGVDLIVVGTRGPGALGRILLGSVASGVINSAHCTVLVVR